MRRRLGCDGAALPGLAIANAFFSPTATPFGAFFFLDEPGSLLSRDCRFLLLSHQRRASADGATTVSEVKRDLALAIPCEFQLIPDVSNRLRREAASTIRSGAWSSVFF